MKRLGYAVVGLFSLISCRLHDALCGCVLVELVCDGHVASPKPQAFREATLDFDAEFERLREQLSPRPYDWRRDGL